MPSYKIINPNHGAKFAYYRWESPWSHHNYRLKPPNHPPKKAASTRKIGREF